jgi:salicylate hydroxylase
MEERVTKVAIAGGGIAGLATAIALRNIGFAVDVYERAGAFGEVGAGITLAPNGVKAIDRLSPQVGQRLRHIGGWMKEGVPYPYLEASGKVKFETPYDRLEDKWGAPLLSVNRAELHTALRECLPEEVLHVDAQVTDFSQDARTMRTNFRAGDAVTSDLVVGADGLHSAIRRKIVGETSPSYLGFTSVRGVVPYVRGGDRFANGFITSAPGAQFFCVFLGNDRLYWCATITAAEGQWPALALGDAKARLLERVHGWHAPVGDVIESTPTDDFIVLDIFDRPPVKSWTLGRAVLVGDAAHPMSPFMGQGANTALEDAVKLGDCLRTATTIESALKAYEASRMSRAYTIVKQSRSIGEIGQSTNVFKRKLMDVTMSVMMRFVSMDKQYAAVFGYSP